VQSYEEIPENDVLRGKKIKGGQKPYFYAETVATAVNTNIAIILMVIMILRFLCAIFLSRWILWRTFNLFILSEL